MIRTTIKSDEKRRQSRLAAKAVAGTVGPDSIVKSTDRICDISVNESSALFDVFSMTPTSTIDDLLLPVDPDELFGHEP